MCRHYNFSTMQGNALLLTKLLLIATALLLFLIIMLSFKEVNTIKKNETKKIEMNLKDKASDVAEIATGHSLKLPTLEKHRLHKKIILTIKRCKRQPCIDPRWSKNITTKVNSFKIAQA